MAKKTKKKEVTTLTTPEVVNKVEIPALTGLEVVAQKALELAESNSKAIKELTDKIQKSSRTRGKVTARFVSRE